MGQTYGQVTGQLLRGSPGLAWPPAHRTLLPPIQSPRSPVISRGRLPPRRGHERLSSGIIPGYTGLYGVLNGCPLPRECVPNTNTASSLLGFIPQAQFIFAKNCNQVWAEAMDDFTQRHGPQESHELSEEAEGRQEEEEGQGPEAEEPELKQEVAQVRWGRLVVGWEFVRPGVTMGNVAVHTGRGTWLPPLSPGSLNLQSYFSFINMSHKASPYSMDDTDPQKFFMSGERTWVTTEGPAGSSRMSCLSISPTPRLHWLRAPRPLPLWLQLPGAHQPGPAGIWADVLTLTGQGAEGSQTCLPTPQVQLPEPGSPPSLWRLRAR